jgi:hypothetical protein
MDFCFSGLTIASATANPWKREPGKLLQRELDDARVGGRASNPSEYRGGFLRRPRIKKLRVVERTEELDVELYRRLFRDINRLLVARYRNSFP